MQQRAQCRVVRIGHVGESLVGWLHGTGQRIAKHQVDVIGDHHEITGTEGPAHTTGGVRGHVHRHAKGMHHAHRERRQRRLMPFIHVKTARHRHHRTPAKAAHQHVAGMANHRGRGEARHLGKRDAHRPGKAVG